jgi:hypothetical protein
MSLHDIRSICSSTHAKDDELAGPHTFQLHLFSARRPSSRDRWPGYRQSIYRTTSISWLDYSFHRSASGRNTADIHDAFNLFTDSLVSTFRSVKLEVSHCSGSSCCFSAENTCISYLYFMHILLWNSVPSSDATPARKC